MAVYLGVDFGTCFSEIGFENGEMQTLKPRTEKKVLCPSVFYRDNNKMEVGSNAVKLGRKNPKFVVEGIKKKLNEQRFELDGVDFTPRQIVEEIFRYLLEGADYDLHNNYKNDEDLFVVITVPAKFQSAEISLIRESAESIRLESGRKITVGGVIKEPTAAALEYFGMTLNTGETIFVYDLGGGTFDAAIVKATGDEKTPYEVIVEDGKGIGGYNWDERLETLMKEKLLKKLTESGQEESKAKNILNTLDLQERAREIKEELSKREFCEDEIEIKGDYYEITVTREEFEKATEALRKETIRIVQHLNKRYSKNHPTESISRVIMVGGGSYMPSVRKAVEEVFTKLTVNQVKPEMAIAYGAARYAKLLSNVSDSEPVPGPEPVPEPLLQKAAHTYGIGYMNEKGEKYIENMIFKGQALPAKAVAYSSLDRESYFAVFESECEENEKQASLEKGCEVLSIHVIQRGETNVENAKQVLILKSDHTLEFTVFENTGGKQIDCVTKNIIS